MYCTLIQEELPEIGLPEKFLLLFQRICFIISHHLLYTLNCAKKNYLQCGSKPIPYEVYFSAVERFLNLAL